MKKIIHHDALSHIGRLHCDNAACGHILPEALPWCPELIGYACPKCGQSMLTESDYLRQEKLLRWIDTVNRWFGWMGHEYPSAKRYRSVSMRVTPTGLDIKEN